MKKYDIFISYRRDKGGKELAMLIYSELVNKHKLSVFMDLVELKDNTFGPQILQAIESAPIFLFVLSEDSLDRCVDENDWVRREILHAVSLDRHIIPVNPENRFKAFPKGLPSQIYGALSDTQQSEVNLGQLFQSSVEKIVKERVQQHLARRFVKKVIATLLLLALMGGSFIYLREHISDNYIHKYEICMEEYRETADSTHLVEAVENLEKAQKIKFNPEYVELIKTLNNILSE